MSSTIEERLRRVEMELEQLKQSQLQPSNHWLSSVAGSFRDDPEFDEILRLGQEIRQSDRPEK